MGVALLKLCRSKSPSARLNDYQRSIGQSRTDGKRAQVPRLGSGRLFGWPTSNAFPAGNKSAETRLSESTPKRTHLLMSAVYTHPPCSMTVCWN